MNYEILRKISKKDYTRLREKVRDNILINSRVAEAKRRIFYEPVLRGSRKEMIVGGLVLEKRVSHRCSLYREGKGWERISLNQLIQQPSLINVLQGIETTSTLVLFDFSGVFTVEFSPPPMGFAFVKEGAVAYVTGNISPMVFGNGQGVYGTHILTEEDMNSYKKGESCFSKEDFSSKKDVTEIKKASIEEELGFLINCGGSSIEIIRRLLVEISHTKDVDLIWAVSAIHGVYHRHPSERLYKLVKKYFYQWGTSQNGMETEDKKEHFLQCMFPIKHNCS